MFHGETLHLVALPDGLVELCFDRCGERVNKFDRRSTDELRAAVAALHALPRLRGVLLTSAKDVFIVGADIAEFGRRFRLPEDELARSLWQDNEVFMALEDLGAPSVAAINGYALGGGCELALTAAYRVMAHGAEMGVPEVRLGLFPGLGGTVRLPRVAGPATAIDWIQGGEPRSADATLAAGLVDAVCTPADLRETALGWLRRAAAGELDWRTRQAAKRAPVPLPPAALDAVFGAAKATCASPHRPAGRLAVELMARAAPLSREGAQWLECEAFARVARSQAGRSMVQAFLDAQAIKRRNRERAQAAPKPLHVAWVGGGPDEPRGGAANLVVTDVPSADLVILHRSDDLAESRAALVLLEARIRGGASIACRTALPLDALAAVLRRPAALVGLAFIGEPGIAEVRRGALGGDEAVAAAVACAVALGRTPIVVRGERSLLDHLLAPCHRAVRRLRFDGADAAEIGCALLAFGWRLPAAFEPMDCRAGDPRATIDAAEIVERVMLPLVIAAATALENGTAESAAEIDTALRLGAGLPEHVGGALQFADWSGLPRLVAQGERHAHLGPDYRPTADMRQMAQTGRLYHDTGPSPA